MIKTFHPSYTNMILIKCALVSSIIVTLCFAADMLISKNDDADMLSINDDGLKSIIKESPPELLPPLLVTCYGWDKNVAAAFALGLALGKQCVEVSSENSSFSANGPQTKCKMMSWSFTWNKYHPVNRVRVVINNLDNVNLEWKYDGHTYDPLTEFFDVQGLKTPENFTNGEMCLEDVRLLLAKHAKKTTAMISVDIAILKWLVSAIKAKPDGAHMVEIGNAIFMPMCALSMSPLIREHCIEDILVVLSQVQSYANPAFQHYTDVKLHTPSLLTVYKFLEDGPVRAKVEEIIARLCFSKKQTFFSIKMLFWKDHPFVKSMETYFSNEELSCYETSLQLQAEWDRKIYSIGHTFFGGLSNKW